MPFNPSNLERVWNPDIQGLDLGIASGWSYNASHDTIAEVLADNYFRTFADYTGFNSTSTTFDLNDQIWCQCSDGNMICQVIAVLPNIIVTQLIPSGFNITDHGVLIGGPNDTINAITLNNGQVLVGATGSDPVATNANSLNLGTTQHAALIGGASGTISSVSLTDNQILVGATGSDPAKKTIVAGTNVTVDNNPTEIVINASGGGSVTLPPEIIGPPFAIFNLCCLPGLFGQDQSDNITQSVDLNSQLVFTPFYVNKDFTTTIFEVLVTTALAGSTATVGVYANNANMRPDGSPLGATTINTASTSNQSGALAVSLTANTLYWAAVQCSSAVTQAIALSKFNNYPGSPGGGFSGTTYVPIIYVYPFTYSAGTLPTINTIFLSNNPSAYGPMIWFL